MGLSSVAFASTQTGGAASARTPAVANSGSATAAQTQAQADLTLKQKLKLLEKKQTNTSDHFIFDLPVTYNKKVATWISFFQTRGKNFFRNWLEKSTKYMPLLQSELKKAGLPTDLAYMVMIESGFSATAVSTAKAVGPWQFIESTGRNYGLKKNWWLDERRDIKKSTQAAIRYLKDLRQEFGSWYLVAASYNMGENGLRRQIRKHGTNDYWELVRLKALPQETQDYVPKILAAMMIAKAPNLYGFRDLDAQYPLQYEVVWAPAGTDLENLAEHLNVTKKAIRDLNAELLLGYVPRQVDGHHIRIPLGSLGMARQFFRDQNKKYALD
ncbi:lytic transglycosylase domain-containing protein [Pseudobdellovibrio exovorus]|uniref:lytic transglycosylase domain-containing protein n=1 Tax=Pseudobdellovibrio exovorus TaxID=453816 RepID=UPI001F291A52|nr:lytic transglycosylase domain-containing protein [Pseudobdellovibrio exovorus]